jgi:hypothetical protein
MKRKCLYKGPQITFMKTRSFHECLRVPVKKRKCLHKGPQITFMKTRSFHEGGNLHEAVEKPSRGTHRAFMTTRSLHDNLRGPS